MSGQYDFEPFVCGRGNTNRIDVWQAMTEKGEKVASDYLTLGDLLEKYGPTIIDDIAEGNEAALCVIGVDFDLIEELEADESDSAKKALKKLRKEIKSVREAARMFGGEEGSIVRSVVEKLLSFRQMLKTVHGINKPKYGLVLANLFEKEIDQVVEAAYEGKTKTPVKRHSGNKKEAREQSQQMLHVLNAFLAGKQTYNICFVVSRVKNGGKRATVLMTPPRSVTEIDDYERVGDLMRITSIELNPVHESNTPNLPDCVDPESDVVKLRLEGMKIHGVVSRGFDQMQITRAVVLKTILRVRRMLEGHLLNDRGTAILITIKVFHGNDHPIINFELADKLCKIKRTTGADIAFSQAKLDALESWPDLEEREAKIVRTRAEMLRAHLKDLNATFDRVNFVLGLFEEHLNIWGDEQRPIIIKFEDIMPHAPIWFTLRTKKDSSSALYEEIIRLDHLFRAEGDIPKPATYLEVASDSDNVSV